MPWKPTVHRPAGAKSAAEVKRELDRQRPSAARRGYDGRWRRARSPVSGGAPAVRPLSGRGPPDRRRRWSTTWCRIEATSGCSGTRTNWQALCKRCHDAKTVRDGRWGQRQLSDGAARSIYGCDVHGMPLDPDHPWNRPAGGWVVAGGPADRDRAGRRCVCAAKFGRGVSGRSAAESLNSCPQQHLDSWPFVRF